jgi:hypothetical protein
MVFRRERKKGTRMKRENMVVVVHGSGVDASEDGGELLALVLCHLLALL